MPHDSAPRDAALKAAGAATVEVLLAAHDSERFLAPQLDSLLAQTYGDFRITVADDCSTDGTAAILRRYAERHAHRFRLLPPVPRRLGPLATFARLLDAADADYVFFCDHDDVWSTDKVAVTLAEMYRAEAQHGRATPILVHTDLAVVGPSLEPIHPSAARYANLRPRRRSVVSLLLNNAVCGCASAANRALCEAARPIPADAMMHDHWLAIVAAAFGEIRYLPQATILYRQHPRNVIGLQPWRPWEVASRIRHTLVGRRKLDVMVKQCRQARALAERFGERLTARDRDAACALGTLWSAPRLERIARLRTLGLTREGPLRALALFYLVVASNAEEP